MFRGESFDEVKDKLTKFRLNNGLHAGNPEQEILLHYAKNWPYMVKEDREATTDHLDEKFVQWRDWVGKTWRNPVKKVVTNKEAANRWEVCQKCPMNTKRDWAETDESVELARRVFIMKAGRDTPSDLGFCSCHKADLSVLPFMDKPKEYSSRKEGELPPACWVL